MEVQISVEEKGEISRDIKIQIPRSLFDERYNSKLRTTGSQAHLKGFRRGKAPRHVVENLYGARIKSDVIGDFVNSAYQDALEEHSLRVVGYPEVQVDSMEDGEDVKVTASVELFPQPDIKDYESCSFEVFFEPFDLDKKVHGEIDRLLEQHASVEPVEERTQVEEGDVIAVDHVAEIDEKDYEPSRANDEFIDLGLEQLLPKFKEALIGASVGDEVRIDHQMPEKGTDPEIAGKQAIYKFKVNAINKKILPELSDELAAESGYGETVAELKSKLQTQFNDERKRYEELARENRLFETIIEKNPFDVPQKLIDEEIRAILFEARLLDPSKKESYSFDVANLREQFGEGAEFRVRRRIITDRIVEQESLEASDEDVNTWLDAKAEERGESRKKVEAYYHYPRAADNLKNHIVRDMRIKELLAGSDIKETVEESKKTDSE